MTITTSEGIDRARRARYAASRDINGILAAMRATEAELIAADLSLSKDKPAQHDAHARDLQIKHQGRDV